LGWGIGLQITVLLKGGGTSVFVDHFQHSLKQYKHAQSARVERWASLAFSPTYELRTKAFLNESQCYEAVPVSIFQDRWRSAAPRPEKY
jgi:predicted HD phosphohydrolase